MKITSFISVTKGSWLALEIYGGLAYVPITVLEQCIRYNQRKFGIVLLIKTKDGYESDHDNEDQQPTLNELLEKSPDVRKFANTYFPEFMI